MWHNTESKFCVFQSSSVYLILLFFLNNEPSYFYCLKGVKTKLDILRR